MSRSDSEIVVEGKTEKKLDNPFSGSAKEKTSNQAETLRFWSTYGNYQIACPGENLQFKDYELILGKSDERLKYVQECESPYVKEILDVPFEDEADKAKFNKFLLSLVYSDENNMPSRRGLMALDAMFNRDERVGAIAGKTDPDALIMKALNGKSFKEGI